MLNQQQLYSFGQIQASQSGGQLYPPMFECSLNATIPTPNIGQKVSFTYPDTTVYSDRLSINYLPISDAFDNREYFFLHYTSDSTCIIIEK